MSFTVPFTHAQTQHRLSVILLISRTEIQTILNEQYEEFNGGTSTLDAQIKNLIFNIITVITHQQYEDEQIIFWINYVTNDYLTLSGAGYTGETNVFDVPSVSLDDTLV